MSILPCRHRTFFFFKFLNMFLNEILVMGELGSYIKQQEVFWTRGNLISFIYLFFFPAQLLPGKLH